MILALALTVLAGDLYAVEADLAAPAVFDGVPSPGRRVRTLCPQWPDGPHHLVSLPTNWEPGARFPVIVELPGNGGYENQLGDACEGTVEGCNLGYGLSAGRDYLWLVVPFVSAEGEAAAHWWGDEDASQRYLLAALDQVIAKWGGDPERVLLCGFSRGAIACNYLGLREDEVASRWSALFCHSHYDGVREGWPYAGADRAAARVRLARLGERPQWISHEQSVEETRAYLAEACPGGHFTWGVLPFPNHSDGWVLRPLALRERARRWLHGACPPGPRR